MVTPNYPPLAIDDELLALLEEYRKAKRTTVRATRGAAVLEAHGNYENDTSLQMHNAQEADAVTTERTAATRLADELLARIDMHR
jgi:hypothetical protein